VSSLELRDVRVTYGQRRVLHGVNARVGPGEWLALLGPNGSGKTSALRAICGLVEFDGEILVGNVSTRVMGKRALARSIALLPQHPVAPPGMRVSTYVLLGRTPHLSYFAQESNGDRAVVAAVLNRLGVARLTERDVASLSGGERQLVVLARALAQQPSILVLDEPTSALDVGHQQDVMEVIDDLRQRDGIAVISAMHDLTVAGQFAGDIVLLADGRVVASGRAGSVLTEERIKEHYGASVRVIQDEADGMFVIPVRSSAHTSGAT
jgi:iron complex transport system ATP-binding protein